MYFDPYPGQEKHLRNVPIGLTAVASFLVAARLVTTYKNRGWFGAEDFFIIVSFVLLLCFCVILVQAARYGFGKHVVDIQRTGGNLNRAFLYYYLSQIFYKTNITINKLAFLFLYLRIFTVNWFRKVCLLMIYLIIASGFAFVILTIFQCTPMKKAWLKSSVKGTCVNLPWFRWTWTGFNLFTDLLIFAMPMPVIFRLHMSLSKKIGLAVVFVIGFFICLTTGLRMKTVVRAAKAKEQTWESCPANLWSFIEVAVGIICACLISLRKMLSIFWPDRLRKTKVSDYHYGSGERSATKRTVPPGSQKLDDTYIDVADYSLEDVSSNMKPGASTYNPDGQLWGENDTVVKGGNARTESQEYIIDPNRSITVRRDVSIQRESS